MTAIAGVAPGIFRRGLTLPTRGLKYGFQGAINAKILQKNLFHLPTGGFSPLALPWSHPCALGCNKLLNVISVMETTTDKQGNNAMKLCQTSNSNGYFTFLMNKNYHTILYYTILNYAMLYYTILSYTTPYYTILYYTILYYTLQYNTILYFTILYYTILYYAILYHTILYYTILYYTILYYTILYYTIL